MNNISSYIDKEKLLAITEKCIKTLEAIEKSRLLKFVLNNKLGIYFLSLFIATRYSKLIR
jgi:hypothetical protein